MVRDRSENVFTSLSIIILDNVSFLAYYYGVFYCQEISSKKSIFKKNVSLKKLCFKKSIFFKKRHLVVYLLKEI